MTHTTLKKISIFVFLLSSSMSWTMEEQSSTDEYSGRMEQASSFVEQCRVEPRNDEDIVSAEVWDIILFFVHADLHLLGSIKNLWDYSDEFELTTRKLKSVCRLFRALVNTMEPRRLRLLFQAVCIDKFLEERNSYEMQFPKSKQFRVKCLPDRLPKFGYYPKGEESWGSQKVHDADLACYLRYNNDRGTRVSNFILNLWCRKDFILGNKTVKFLFLWGLDLTRECYRKYTRSTTLLIELITIACTHEFMGNSPRTEKRPTNKRACIVYLKFLLIKFAPFAKEHIHQEKNQKALYRALKGCYQDDGVADWLLEDAEVNFYSALHGGPLLNYFLQKQSLYHNCWDENKIFTIVKFLLSRGAHPNTKDNNYLTPLEILMNNLKKGDPRCNALNSLLPFIRKTISILLIYGADGAQVIADTKFNEEGVGIDEAEKKKGMIDQEFREAVQILPYGSLKNLCFKVILNNFNVVKDQLKYLPQELLNIINMVSNKRPIKMELKNAEISDSSDESSGEDLEEKSSESSGTSEDNQSEPEEKFENDSQNDTDDPRFCQLF